MSATYTAQAMTDEAAQQPLHDDISVVSIVTLPDNTSILTTYKIKGGVFYGFCRQAISFLSAPPEGDAPQELKMKAALMKAGVKALLLSAGPLIQKFLYGDEKNHPKPGKDDLIIDWYANAFCQKAVAWAMKNTIVLKGVAEGDGICRVNELSAKSNTVKASSVESTQQP